MYSREQFCALTGMTVDAYKSDRRQGFLPQGARSTEHLPGFVNLQTGEDLPPRDARLVEAEDRRYSKFPPFEVLQYAAILELRDRLKMTAAEANSIVYNAAGLLWSQFDEGRTGEIFLGVVYLKEGREHFGGNAAALAARMDRPDVSSVAVVSLDAVHLRVADRGKAAGLTFPADLRSAVMGAR